MKDDDQIKVKMTLPVQMTKKKLEEKFGKGYDLGKVLDAMAEEDEAERTVTGIEWYYTVGMN